MFHLPNLRRQFRKLQSVSIPRFRVRRHLFKYLRITLVVIVFLFVTAFITPARNTVGYFFIPSSWQPLSSGQIIKMFYMEERRFPVELGETVTCDAVEAMMKKVDWQKLVSELKSLPAYDDSYYKHIASHPEIYGATPEEVEILNQRFSNFKPPMSGLWQRELRLTFRVFFLAMKTFNVSYFFSEGSMLGVYRHHGLIPWDDDLDLVMNGTDWLKVKQILHCIPGFDVDTSSYMMYKFFWKQSDLLKGSNFLRVPYIDIFFFTEDDEYIWALSSIKKHRIVFKKRDIFPLIYRPFEQLLVPVPRTFEQLCKKMYDPTVCVSRDFDHLSDRPLIPFYEYEYKSCNLFKKIYPFVERRNVTIRSKPATIEYRKIGKKTLSNFTVFHS